MNGSAVQPMDSSSPEKGVWVERFAENQIYLKANVMAIQLAFIGLPLVIGLAAAGLMILVPTPLGRTAGLILGTAIFPSLGICWWLARMSKPTHFHVYKGHISDQGTQKLFEHERPNITVKIEVFYHLSINGLHTIPHEHNEVTIALPHAEQTLAEGQSAYFICLPSEELIAHHAIDR